MRKILQAMASQPWLIEETALRQMVAIASGEGDLEALQKKLGDKVEGQEREGTYVRDGVGVLDVYGPLFKRANLFTMVSGASSYELMARDFNRLVEDDDVHSIILNIDSPGGAVNGTSEFAQQIKAARGVKPVVAFAADKMASAAYWIGSAADRIVAANTAEIGSIGVVMTVMAGKNDDTLEIVSYQSPKKRIDVSTKEGRSELQGRVDDLANIFIQTVAEHRGLSADDVLERFGQGGVMLASKAIDAGMADEEGTLEGLIQQLTEHQNAATGGNSITTVGGETMPKSEANAAEPAEEMVALSGITAAFVAENCPDTADALRQEGQSSVDVEAIRTEAAEAERARITGILEHQVPGNAAIAAVIDDCVADADCSPDGAASKVLKKARDGGIQHLASMQADESNLDAPSAGSDSAGSADEDPALAQMLDLGKATGRIPQGAQ